MRSFITSFLLAGFISTAAFAQQAPQPEQPQPAAKPWTFNPSILPPDLDAAARLVTARMAAESVAESAPAPKEEKTKIPLQWNWDTFPKAEVAITAAGLAGTITGAVMKPVITTGPWKNPVDDWGNKTLQLRSAAARSTIGTISDVGVVGVLLVPVVGASVRAADDKDLERLGKTIGVIAALYSAVNGTDGIAKNFIGRDRPCKTLQDAPCTGADAQRSFPSEHSSNVAAAAAMCWKADLGLGWCIPTTGGAVFVSLARVMAGKHNLTDITAGALVAVAEAVALPIILHINIGKSAIQPTDHPVSDTQDSKPRPAVAMTLGPSVGSGPAGTPSVGALLSGSFD
jgi:hypothetical protein